MRFFKKYSLLGAFNNILSILSKEESYQKDIIRRYDNALVALYKALFYFYDPDHPKRFSDYNLSLRTLMHKRNIDLPTIPGLLASDEAARKHALRYMLNNLHEIQSELSSLRVYNQKIAHLCKRLKGQLLLIRKVDCSNELNRLTIQEERLVSDRQPLSRELQKLHKELIMLLDDDFDHLMKKPGSKPLAFIGKSISLFSTLISDLLPLSEKYSELFLLEKRIKEDVKRYKKMYADDKKTMDKLNFLEENAITLEEHMLADFREGVRFFLKALSALPLDVKSDQLFKMQETIGTRIIKQNREVDLRIVSKDDFHTNLDKCEKAIQDTLIYASKATSCADEIDKSLKKILKGDRLVSTRRGDGRPHYLTKERYEILLYVKRIAKHIKGLHSSIEGLRSEINILPDENSFWACTPSEENKTENILKTIEQLIIRLLHAYQRIQGLCDLEKEVKKLEHKHWKIYQES